MPKILYIYDGKMNMKGCDLVTHFMLEALSDSHHDVDFISRGQVSMPGVQSKRLWYSPAKVFSNMRSATYAGARRRFLSWIGACQLKRGNYDLAITWSLSARTFFQEARRSGVKTVLQSGNIHWKARGLAEHQQVWPAMDYRHLLNEYRLADSIHVYSEYCRSTFTQNGISSEKVVNIGHGADLEKFYPPEEPPRKFIAIVIGRVCERKGVEQLIAAWKRASLPDAELWWAGDIDRGVAHVVQHNEDPSIKFLGFRDDIANLLRQASIQVLLSRSEGSPKGLLEGAACGLPTVASPGACYPTAANSIGFTVDRDNPEEIARYLRKFHADPQLLSEMRGNARKYALENFTWAKFKQNFSEQIDRLLQSR